MQSECVGQRFSFQMYSDEGHLSYVLVCVCKCAVGTGGVSKSWTSVFGLSSSREGQENRVIKREGGGRCRNMKENKSQGRKESRMEKKYRRTKGRAEGLKQACLTWIDGI